VKPPMTKVTGFQRTAYAVHAFFRNADCLPTI